MLPTENQTRDLVLELYRGVVVEDSWLRGLDLLAEALRGSAVFFGTLAPDGSGGMIAHGADSNCAALLGGPLRNPEANPFIRPMMTKRIGRAYPTVAMCGDAALVRSEMYQQALRPHGQRFVLGAMLEPIGRTARTVAWTRPGGEGDYADEEVGFVNAVLPHLARAAHLRDQFAGVQRQTYAAFAALESVPRGIVILTGELEPAFANREAQRIFALGDGLHAGAAGIRIGDRRAADALRGALGSVSGDLHPSVALPGPIAVPRPSGKLPFALRVVPAPELLLDRAPGGRPPVTLTIIDPERETAPSIPLLRQIYGLTPVEAKLAAALCEMELKQAAAGLGISINTAKTHLQAIFQKVGVSRQSALVRLVSLHCTG